MGTDNHEPNKSTDKICTWIDQLGNRCRQPTTTKINETWFQKVFVTTKQNGIETPPVEYTIRYLNDLSQYEVAGPGATCVDSDQLIIKVGEKEFIVRDDANNNDPYRHKAYNKLCALARERNALEKVEVYKASDS